MACYKLIDGEFKEVEDPVTQAGTGDYTQNIHAAGFVSQISSSIESGPGAEVTLYSRTDNGTPQHYIDVFGGAQQIACLVADDFPALVRTLKEIAPLIAMVGLDQRASIEIDATIRREKN